jgi:hypothetical protein
MQELENKFENKSLTAEINREISGDTHAGILSSDVNNVILWFQE